MKQINTLPLSTNDYDAREDYLSENWSLKLPMSILSRSLLAEAFKSLETMHLQIMNSDSNLFITDSIMVIFFTLTVVAKYSDYKNIHII